MERAPLQVLIFPIRQKNDGKYEFALFKRQLETGGFWQGIAGGAHAGETALAAAKRETFEEAGISTENHFIELKSMAFIPAAVFAEFSDKPEISGIPEYCFGVEFQIGEIKLSDEHIEYRWLSGKDACETVRFDSNRNALWELQTRLKQS